MRPTRVFNSLYSSLFTQIFSPRGSKMNCLLAVELKVPLYRNGFALLQPASSHRGERRVGRAGGRGRERECVCAREALLRATRDPAGPLTQGERERARCAARKSTQTPARWLSERWAWASQCSAWFSCPSESSSSSTERCCKRSPSQRSERKIRRISSPLFLESESLQSLNRRLTCYFRASSLARSPSHQPLRPGLVHSGCKCPPGLSRPSHAARLPPLAPES